MRPLVIIALCVVSLFAVAGVASGTPGGDSAVGGGQTAFDEIGFGLSAHSGPAGEDAHGHFSAGISLEPPFPKVGEIGVPVTCLNVVANRATIGGVIEQSNAPGGGEVPFFAEGESVILVAIDNGNPASGTPDMLGLIAAGLPVPPTVCPPPPLVSDPIARGNITITDA